MGLYSRLMRNSLMAMVATCWGIGLAFFLIPYLIRTMGQEGFGVWILVTSLSVTSGYLALLDPGIQGATVKFVAHHLALNNEEQLRKTIWISFSFFLILGLVTSSCLALFGAFFATQVFNIPDNLHNVVRVLFYLLALQSFFDFAKVTWVSVYSGLERYDLLRLVQIGFSSVSAGLIVLFFSLGFDITFAGIANLLASIFTFFVLTLWLPRFLPSISIWKFPRNWRWQDVKPLFQLGSGLFGFRVTGILFRNVDTLIISTMLTSTLLAPYAVASYFYRASQSVRSFVPSNFVPIASGLAALDRGLQLKEAFLRGTRFTIALTVPVVMVGIWLADPAVTYWVGGELIEAALLAKLFLAVTLFTATNAVGFNVMIGMGKIKPLLKINICSLLLNVFLSLVLVRPFGLIGIVTATLVSHLLVWYPYSRLYLTTLEISWWEYLQKGIGKPYLTMALVLPAIGVIGYYVNPATLIQTIIMGACAVIVYLCIFFVIGMDDVERRTIYHLLAPSWYSVLRGDMRG